MDDDDGLLLNFATPDTSVSSASTSSSKANSKVTGGKWKDRRKLQLALQGRTPKKIIEPSGVNNIHIDKSRIEQIRRQKQSDSQTKRSPQVPHLGPSSKRVKFSETKGEHGGKDNSYVSSLFTSNEPSSTLTPTTTTDDGTATSTPSNAPLLDATTFEGLGLNEKLTHHLTSNLRFKTPTKIQRLVIPRLMSQSSDLFVKAQTGSGKTLSFLLPIYHALMTQSPEIERTSGVFAIILAPTRELATQIHGVCETLSRTYVKIVPGIVIGGEKKKSEKARLRKGVNILVGTPGRLADHFENTKTLDLGEVRYLVLDEGDKLMELGFEQTITEITDKISQGSKIRVSGNKWPTLPKKRINVLCSATIQNNVKKLGSILLDNPEMITVDTSHVIEFDERDETTAPDQLMQNVVVVPPKLRLVTLASILKNITKSTPTSSSRTIVFFSCSDSVNFHFDVFTRSGSRFKKIKNQETGEITTVLVPIDSDNDADDDSDPVEESTIITAPLLSPSTTIYKLHGSLSQQLRTTTLQSFTKDSSSHQILFCTDVASRGLDLPNISRVIEYDPPFSVDDHLHRIGRSARLGQSGEATLFLLPGVEEGYVDGKLRVVHPKEGNLKVLNYEKILAQGFAEEKEGEDGSEKKQKDDPKRKTGKWDIHATTFHLDIERWLLESTSMHEKAVQAFTSHIRAYATHLSSERTFFNVKLLHLGHLAKSFGLRETPKKLGKSMGAITESRKVKKEDPKKKMMRMAKMAVKSNSSEFNY
ncbi:DBP7 [[Candida] subhashii]|uniref:ATP-dependent RNA helicase n=1 Tax=[Candida] subhashii TaxID=561895 RepID=A0A8J5V499_9ASCO|nr:DBP7 [[Candida] subhashii]KAG7664999.1 DBP7 [[Candida] subhashii]